MAIRQSVGEGDWIKVPHSLFEVKAWQVWGMMVGDILPFLMKLLKHQQDKNGSKIGGVS